MNENVKQLLLYHDLILSIVTVCVLVIIVIALAIIKSYMKKLASGQTSSVDTDHVEAVGVANKDKNSYPYELILTVADMNCTDCATRIENMLNQQESVFAQASEKSYN